MEAKRRTVAGAMSGTSLDGVDAAKVDVIGAGLDLRARLRRHAFAPMPAECEAVRRAARGDAVQLESLATGIERLSICYVEAMQAALDGDAADLAAVHGQTVYHAPPLSWQLIAIEPIASALACPIVSDLRAADLAAGGEGAPITPLADWVMFRDPAESRAIVNLGGFCNATILPAGQAPESIQARDVCACNHILDGAARRVLATAYDADGASARRGTVNQSAADDLSARLHAQQSAGRSLGTGDECAAWLDEQAERFEPDDLMATVTNAVGAAIGQTLTGIDAIYLAGGGARNAALAEAITQRSNARVQASDALGCPVEAREAMAMAVLGALCADGVPITLPQVTGCRTPAPVSGQWSRYPQTPPCAPSSSSGIPTSGPASSSR